RRNGVRTEFHHRNEGGGGEGHIGKGGFIEPPFYLVQLIQGGAEMDKQQVRLVSQDGVLPKAALSLLFHRCELPENLQQLLHHLLPFFRGEGPPPAPVDFAKIVIGIPTLVGFHRFAHVLTSSFDFRPQSERGCTAPSGTTPVH